MLIPEESRTVCEHAAAHEPGFQEAGRIALTGFAGPTLGPTSGGLISRCRTPELVRPSDQNLTLHAPILGIDSEGLFKEGDEESKAFFETIPWTRFVIPPKNSIESPVYPCAYKAPFSSSLQRSIL